MAVKAKKKKVRRTNSRYFHPEGRFIFERSGKKFVGKLRFRLEKVDEGIARKILNKLDLSIKSEFYSAFYAHKVSNDTKEIVVYPRDYGCAREILDLVIPVLAQKPEILNKNAYSDVSICPGVSYRYDKSVYSIMDLYQDVKSTMRYFLEAEVDGVKRSLAKLMKEKFRKYMIYDINCVLKANSKKLHRAILGMYEESESRYDVLRKLFYVDAPHKINGGELESDVIHPLLIRKGYRAQKDSIDNLLVSRWSSYDSEEMSEFVDEYAIFKRKIMGVPEIKEEFDYVSGHIKQLFRKHGVDFGSDKIGVSKKKPIRKKQVKKKQEFFLDSGKVVPRRRSVSKKVVKKKLVVKPKKKKVTKPKKVIKSGYKPVMTGATNYSQKQVYGFISGIIKYHYGKRAASIAPRIYSDIKSKIGYKESELVRALKQSYDQVRIRKKNQRYSKSLIETQVVRFYNRLK